MTRPRLALLGLAILSAVSCSSVPFREMDLKAYLDQFREPVEFGGKARVGFVARVYLATT